MKPQNEREENPFFDKRDEIYRCLESDSHFFEFFSSKRDKCNLRITDVIIFQQGRPAKWFFNSAKDTSNKVLMKNSDKLSVHKIFGYYSGLAKQSEGLLPLQIVDQLKNEQVSHTLTNFIRLKNKEKFLATPLEIVKLLHERANEIECIQGIVQLKTISLNSKETHYCEYRNDPNNVGPLCRFFKKSFFVGKRKELKSLKLQESKTSNIYQEDREKAPINKLWSVYEASKEYPTLARTNIDFVFLGHQGDPYLASGLQKNYQAEKNLDVRVHREIERGYINKLTKTNLIMNHDQMLTRKLDESTRALVRFIESAYKIKVRKFVLKFLLDREGNTIFIGGKEFYFDLAPNAEYDHIAVGSTLGAKITYESLVELTQHTHKEKARQVIYKDPYAIKGTRSKSDALATTRQRPISANLYQKMMIHECKGDFCDFFVNNPDKALLGIEDRIIASDAAYKTKLYKRANLKEIVNKPFEITNVLKMKCRERIPEVVSVLKQNHILPLQLKGQIYGYNYDEHDPVFFQQLLSVFNQRKMVENIDGLYSNLKVCNTCYTVYSLAIKHFDSNEQSNDSYYKFNQRYSKVGLIGIHHTTRRDTDQSRRDTEQRGELTKGSFLFGGTRLNTRQGTRQGTRQATRQGTRQAIRQGARPITGKESILDKFRTETTRLATEPINTDYDEHTSKNLAQKFKLNLGRALKTEGDDDDNQTDDDLFGRINTEVYDRDARITEETFPEIRGKTPEIRGKTPEIRSKTPEIRLRAQSSKGKEETGRRRKLSLNLRSKQSISSNRMNMGLLSYISGHPGHAANGVQTVTDRGETKHINLYKLISDNPSKSKMSLGTIEEGQFTNGQRKRGAMNPPVDAKRASMFEGLIKNIHPEFEEKETKALFDEKVRVAELSSSRSFRHSSALLVEQLKKTNKDIINPTRIDSMYTGFQSVRHIHPNKITTNKVPFDLKTAKDFEELKSIPLDQYCNKAKIQPPQVEEIKELFFFVYDMSVGIPFCVLKSDILEEEDTLRNIVICNDMFDNFVEHIKVYKKFLSENDNTRIILFNIPGQGYTSYNPSIAYNNELCANIVDTLLLHLEETQKISFVNPLTTGRPL